MQTKVAMAIGPPGRLDLIGRFTAMGTVDRLIRDLRASLYHPYAPDTTALHPGQHRLGLPLDPL